MEELPKASDISFCTCSTPWPFLAAAVLGGRRSKKRPLVLCSVCTCPCEMEKVWQSPCVPRQIVCCRKMIHVERLIRVPLLVMRAGIGVFTFLFICVISLNEGINCFHCHVNQNMQ